MGVHDTRHGHGFTLATTAAGWRDAEWLLQGYCWIIDTPPPLSPLSRSPMGHGIITMFSFGSRMCLLSAHVLLILLVTRFSFEAPVLASAHAFSALYHSFNRT